MINKRLRSRSGTYSVEGIHYLTGKPVSIEIADGNILNINELPVLPGICKNILIAPGFIDNQINGFANVDFSGNNLSAEKIISATRAIWMVGVTSYMPTLITNSHDSMIKNLGVLDEACRTDEMVNESVPGFHLEGPYLSPEEGFRGCHPAQHLRKPSWKEFCEFQDASGGRIIQVTVAPEIEGAQEFIKRCSSEGIIVAIGHTNASLEQINSAVDNGAKISTHLGNGCANYIHRHKNPIWPQLANDRLVASLIADGHHLLPEEIKVFYTVKGTANIILTSDVIYLSGMAPGKYSFLGMEVILKEDGMLLNEKLDCLAGASFPLKKGVENIMNYTGCSISEAIKMASENVARIYGLDNMGTLKPGSRADLILFEMEGNRLLIQETLKNGISVYSENE
jgi:N-acetylglucosamine-6-phosphate deacetylase